ncbi:MAG: hypothetical protein M1821_006875 [Bathelium mastoideum]|nr:MAG: hypothetical protein M1821_006875 [Bathelium mastoideum]KAI9676309.1 MAG: hypothetical protein M1822_008343 [Bathelium mastoideum]
MARNNSITPDETASGAEDIRSESNSSRSPHGLRRNIVRRGPESLRTAFIAQETAHNKRVAEGDSPQIRNRHAPIARSQSPTDRLSCSDSDESDANWGASSDEDLTMGCSSRTFRRYRPMRSSIRAGTSAVSNEIASRGPGLSELPPSYRRYPVPHRLIESTRGQIHTTSYQAFRTGHRFQRSSDDSGNPHHQSQGQPGHVIFSGSQRLRVFPSGYSFRGQSNGTAYPHRDEPHGSLRNYSIDDEIRIRQGLIAHYRVLVNEIQRRIEGRPGMSDARFGDWNYVIAIWDRELEMRAHLRAS